MDLKKFTRSFGYALKGIGKVIASQQNMQVHLVVAVLVIVAGFFFNITLIEWCMVIFAIGLVWTAETFNSAFESVTDLVQPEIHPLAGKAKDMAAGAVLISAITAAIIGILVFGKYLIRFAG